MHIIDTIKILNPKSQILPLWRDPKSQRLFGYWILFMIWCLSFGILSGCSQRTYLSKAQTFATQSQTYYQEAVNLYRELIIQGRDLDKLRLELGKLYYSHGDFEQAIEELKKTN